MIVVDEFRGRLVGVLGLAKSGRAAAQSLAAGGALYRYNRYKW